VPVRFQLVIDCADRTAWPALSPASPELSARTPRPLLSRSPTTRAKKTAPAIAMRACPVRRSELLRATLIGTGWFESQ